MIVLAKFESQLLDVTRENKEKAKRFLNRYFPLVILLPTKDNPQVRPLFSPPVVLLSFSSGFSVPTDLRLLRSSASVSLWEGLDPRSADHRLGPH